MRFLPHLSAALLAVAIVCLCLAPAPVAAQEPASVTALRTSLEQLQQSVSEVEQEAFAEDTTDAVLATMRARLDRLSRHALEVALAVSGQMKEINQQLADLGPAPDADAPPEAETVARERQRLTTLRGEATLIVRDAEQLAVQTGILIDRINALRRELFVSDIFARSSVTGEFWSNFVERARREVSDFNRLMSFWARAISSREPRHAIYAALISIAFALALAFGIARYVFPLYARPPVEQQQPYLRRLFSALWTALVPSAAVVASLAVAFLVFRSFALLPANVENVFRILCTALGGLTFFFFLTRALLAPGRHNWRLFQIPERAARRLTALASLMATVYAIDYFLTQMSVSLSSPVVVIVGKSFFATLIIAVLLAAIMLTRLDDPDDRRGVTRGWRPWFFWLMWVVIALMVGGVVAGFVSFGRFLSSQVVVTGAILVTMYVGILSARAVSQVGALGETQLGHYLARTLKFSKLAVDQFGLVLGLALYAAVLIVGIPVVLLQWGFQQQDVLGWVTGFFSGFSVGEVNISLGAILIAVLAFGVGLVLTRMFQRWMSSNILARTRLDSGVKHSVNAGIGYLGVLLAVIFALQYAGLDLSNLALIAGALSVGIGFGLQNVVSNFVSGIILLIERPIRVGDWIVVGANEGIVKKISVRATEVETFDRKSIVIPNSELINTSVANWMLKDKTGRLTIEVGVSYQSDEEKVRDILYELIRGDERIAEDPEPYVFFKDFGDSALIFQQRMFLKDVGDIIRVAGEMRFAIRKAFRENGIEIPFPQRDIHVVAAPPESADVAQATRTRKKR